MSDQIPISVLEQLRTYDGQLFQNESILALQVDVKSFVWTHITSSLRTETPLNSFLDWSDDFSEKIVKSFRNVRPKITNDLAEAVRVYQGLLKGRFTQVKVVIQDAQIHGLSRGMFKRVLQHEVLKTKQAIEQDPIKVDFIFREAFRMTLHHDCTILIETEDEDLLVVPERAKRRVQYWGGEEEEETAKAETVQVEDTQDESKQDTQDETKQVEDIQDESKKNQEDNEIHNVEALDNAKVSFDDEKLESASVTAPPDEVEETKHTRSNSPPSTPVGSVVSRAMTALTQVNQLRKPRVRTIVLGPSHDDDMQSRFTSSSRRK